MTNFFAENFWQKSQKIVIITSTPSTVEKSCPKIGATSNFQSSHPGVDVMTTIFCDFGLFIGVFSKTNVIIKSLHNLALL
jgi:hypothetical protein